MENPNFRPGGTASVGGTSQHDERFVGLRLQLLRSWHGLTQKELGERVEIDSALISRVENEKQEPSDGMVQMLCEELGVDQRYFYSPAREVFREQECNFRHLRSASAKEKARLLAYGTFISELLAELREELEFPPYDVPSIEARRLEAIEQAAEHCREQWGLGLGPILNMIAVAEHAGVPVIRVNSESLRVDAFSRYGTTTVIVLNSAKGSTSRARFDVAHEIGHLVLHGARQAGTKEEEEHADRFASAFLLPAEPFRREFRFVRGHHWWSYVFELKRRWGASVQAIVRRAHDLSLLTSVQYRRAYKYIYYKGWHKGEPMEPPPEQPSLLRVALRNYGRYVADVGGLRERFGWGPRLWHIVTAGFELPSAPAPPLASVFPSHDYRGGAA